jgi:cytochrome c oxidase subunit 2
MSWWESLRRLSRATPPGGWRLERAARWISLVLILGIPAALLAGLLGAPGRSGRAIELVARQPAAGGWSLDRIVVNRGEWVRLRIQSEDVVHGFAIGRLGVDAGSIEPGKTATVEFVADQAGEFTFYCTMWCDPDHPRMRGILEVRGPGPASAEGRPAARDVELQHLDAPREAPAAPPARPSAVRGRALYDERCASCHGGRGEGTDRGKAIGRRESRQERSPIEVLQILAAGKGQPASAGTIAHAQPSGATRVARSHNRYGRGWSAQDRWDVVAFVWSLGTSSDRIAIGERLYLSNCAACHGERGAGDGPGGKYQPKKPADFTDARRMLAGTGALYTAKIRRGGMGTGMPYWGSIFTEEELAALVDYVWTFSLGGPP